MTYKAQLKITALIVLLFCAGGLVLMFFGYQKYTDIHFMLDKYPMIKISSEWKLTYGI